MEGGAPGLRGMSASCMGRFRGIEAATILHLCLGLLVREKTNRKKAVVSHKYLLEVLLTSKDQQSQTSDDTQAERLPKYVKF